MFERYSRDAREVVVGAQVVARSLADSEVRATHLLVSLTDAVTTRDLLATQHVDRDALLGRIADLHRDGLDESALSALGIDLGAIRTSVESTFGEGALDAEPPRPRRWSRRRGRIAGHLPFTGGAKKALELSLREALRLHLDAIEAEAVLLGVLRADDREVRHVLAALGVEVAALRRATESRLRRAA